MGSHSTAPKTASYRANRPSENALPSGAYRFGVVRLFSFVFLTPALSVFLNISIGDSILPPLHASTSKDVSQRITSTCIASRVVDKDHGKVAITDRLSVCVPFPRSKSVPLSGMYDSSGDHFSSKNQIAMCNTLKMLMFLHSYGCVK